MKKFIFRLEKFFSAKKSLAKAAAQAYAQELSVLNGLIADKNTICEKINGYLRLNHINKEGFLDINGVQFTSSYIDTLRSHVSQIEIKIKYTEARVNEFRLKLDKVTKEKKILENLRGEMAQNHKEESNKREQKEIDGLIIMNPNLRRGYETSTY